MFRQFHKLDHFVQHLEEKLTLGRKLTFKFTTINYHPPSFLPFMKHGEKLLQAMYILIEHELLVSFHPCFLTHLFQISYSLLQTNQMTGLWWAPVLT